MIKKMRENAPAIMVVALVSFIATIFFSWGMGSSGRPREEKYIGKIGKEKIPIARFYRQVEMEREKLRMNSEGQVTPQQMRMVPRQVWESEVSRILHKKVFKELALSGSPEEVFEHLKKNPPPGITQHPRFLTDSIFDTSKYVQFLNDPQSFEDPGLVQLESYTRDVIIPIETLKRLIETGVAPTKAEIEQEYRDEYDKAVFEYVKVTPSSFDVDSSEITETMIESYYKANPDTFSEDAQAELYFIRFPKVATAEDEKVYMRELIEIKKRIDEGESTFEEEAKIESDDEGSAVNGGDLGWFKKGEMVPEFEEVAFSIKPGTISDPVKSNFGYHLIWVEEREEQDSIVKVKARHILRKIQPTAETLDSLEEYIETLRKAMLEKGFFEAVADDENLQADSTGLFKKGDMILGIGYLSGAYLFAFSDDEEAEKVSERMENEFAFFLLTVKRRTEKGLLPITDVRERIFWTLKDSLQTAKARAYLEKNSSTIAAEPTLASLKDTDSLFTSGVTDTVARKIYIPDVGYNNPAVVAAFSLPEGQISKVMEADRAFFIVKPLWKDIVDSIPWGSDAVYRVTYALIEESRKNVYMDWYVNYRKKINIEEKLDKFFE